MKMSAPLYTYYGDDFTGSTDVLEQLALGGVRAALFFQPPDANTLQRFGNLQAVGVAGDSRSQTPEWMTEELPAIFAELMKLGAPVLHYKVCSTFDSSPSRGSIGRAIELGLERVGSRFVPVVVGAPHLRRYVLDGKLFASDPTGRVHRIDRHPMRNHPVTPMREPKLKRHLAQQTKLHVCESVCIASSHELHDNLERCIDAGNKVVVFDTVTQDDLAHVGALLLEEARREPIFAVGSSGLTSALIAGWRSAGLLSREGSGSSDTLPAAQPKTPLLVLSGSCSAATERQLRWALEHGFHGVRSEPDALLRNDRSLDAFVIEVHDALQQGRDTVIYTAMGTPAGKTQGDALGTALGNLLNAILERVLLQRVLLCGGDTSSHAVKQLGLTALTWSRSLQTGAPLCRAHASGPCDGLELVLKGGQVGTDDFFAIVRDA